MTSSANGSLFNGIDLSFELSFGAYQTVIDKNAYYIGDDEIVCYELVKRKQSFIVRRIEDSDASAMSCYSGKRSNNQQVSTVAVALKGSSKELPTVIVYEKNQTSHNQIVLSHLGLNMNIVSVQFVYKGRFLAILAEIEPQVKYHLAVCGSSSSSGAFYKEDLHGNCVKIEQCLFENTYFTIASDDHVLIYQLDPKGETVTLQTERIETVRQSLDLQPGDTIVDHCWLETEKKMIVATKHSLYVFDSYVLEQVIPFEFPGSEFKKLIKEKPADKLLEEMYASAEYIIDYLNPTGGDNFSTKVRPDYLKSAVEAEISKMQSERQIESFKEDDRKNILRRVYAELSKKILQQKSVRIYCLCK